MRVAAGIVLALAAALAAVVLHVRRAPVLPDDAPAVWRPSPLQFGTGIGAAAAAHAPAPPPSAPAPAQEPALAQGEARVCGVGTVSLAGEDLPAPMLQSQGRALDAVAGLEESPDLAVRAAALAVGAVSAPAFDSTRDGAPALAALATLAATTADPAVYGLAWQACRGAGNGLAACQRLNAAQWARLEPDNAQPWLAVAETALLAHDAAGVAEALYRASLATRLDDRWGAVAARLMPALPANLAPLDRSFAMTAAWSVSVVPASSDALVAGHCSQRSLADANRRQVCESLATLLSERSRSTYHRALGLAMAKRLGWPPARQEALRIELDAARAVLAQGVPQDERQFECEPLRRAERWHLHVARAGELGAAAEAVQASGSSPAAWAQGWRAAQAAPAVAATAGAVAPAAASAASAAQSP